MLKFNLPREPTFKIERPKNCKLREINSDHIPKQLLPFFDLTYKFFDLISDNKVLKDKYIVEKKKKKIFIKIIEVQNIKLLNLTNAIEDYIFKKKVNSLKFLKAFKCKFNKNTFILLYKYVDSRFFNSTEKDVINIGKKLGELHNTLLFFPQMSLVRNYSVKRFDYINTLFEKILRTRSKLKINSVGMEIVKKCKLKRKYFFNNYSQTIHGDLNYSNIIFDKIMDNPIFVDFETSCFSWEDPLFDVAQVIDRFIGNQEKNPRKLTNIFLESYSSVTKRHLNIDELSIIIEQRSIKSLLLLIAKEQVGLKVCQSEYDKFLSKLNFGVHRNGKK
tara:strand:+ start:516 stop:1511 length:996 start_codon:yes stop_codon:yes gene_type:complete